jgi:hypothetical protein
VDCNYLEQLIRDCSRIGANGLLAGRGLSCYSYASGEILLNQAFRLPPFWNGLLLLLHDVLELVQDQYDRTRVRANVQESLRAHGVNIPEASQNSAS